MTAKFVKTICIELDMLTLMSNQSWYWSIRIPKIFSHINWRGVVNIFKCVRVPECASEGFY